MENFLKRPSPDLKKINFSVVLFLMGLSVFIVLSFFLYFKDLSLFSSFYPKPKPFAQTTPQFSIQASTSSSNVSAGSSVNISATITTTQNIDVLVDIEVYDNFGNQVFQNFFDNQSFQSNLNNVFNASFNIPSTAHAGVYNIDVGIFGTNWNGLYLWKSGAASFNLTSSVAQPGFTITSNATPSSTSAGSSVNVDFSITSQSIVGTALDIDIVDALGDSKFNKLFLNQAFNTAETKQYNFTWDVSQNTLDGVYTVNISVLSDDFKNQYGFLGNGDASATKITVNTVTSPPPPPGPPGPPPPGPPGPPSTGGKSADLNSNGKVDIFDLSIMLRAWGKNDYSSDLNSNGKVDIFDLSILLRSWG